MKNQLLILCACMLALLPACTNPDPAGDPAAEYFVTKDLSFLQEGLPGTGAKGWPANGCQNFEITLKFGFLGEVKTDMLHCCVNYVCNAVAFTEILNFFLGKNKASGRPDSVEVTTSERLSIRGYDIRVRPGHYRLDAKTGQLEDLEYEVWVNR